MDYGWRQWRPKWSEGLVVTTSVISDAVVREVLVGDSSGVATVDSVVRENLIFGTSIACLHADEMVREILVDLNTDPLVTYLYVDGTVRELLMWDLPASITADEVIREIMSGTAHWQTFVTIIVS